MVSKARLDLPEPESPVMTIRLSRGRSTSTPFRLCSRAPRTEMWVRLMGGVCSRFVRSEVRRVGEESVRTRSIRWSAAYYKTYSQLNINKHIIQSKKVSKKYTNT